MTCRARPRRPTAIYGRAAEFPAELTWLWRDYDPAKTSQQFDQDPGEKSRPPFRVTITNRQDAQ